MDAPVAFVTGAGSGIGRATAVMLAAEGYGVALVGRREAELRGTGLGLPASADHLVLPADIGSAAGAIGALERALERWGRVDALVNNAGCAPMAPIEAHTPAMIDEVYRVNALGPSYLIAAAWPAFARQFERDGRGGCVVNIATQGIDDPYPGFFAYAAAKAAAATMVKSCAKEGAAIGVRAFAIAPGAVETGMFRALFPESAVPRSATMAPETVARVIVECIRGVRDAENGGVIRLKGS
ncbi:MAG: SDR family oxidoreductase [Phycisphaerales bacterium]